MALVTISGVAQSNNVSSAQAHTPLNRILRVDPDPLEDGYLIVGDEGGQLVTVANATQDNSASQTAVSQSTTVMVTVADTAQDNAASSASVQATQLVQSANANQTNEASPAAIQETHNIAVSSVAQGNAAAAAYVSQSHLVAVANASQNNTTTAGSVSQSATMFVSPFNADQANDATAVAVSQTHLVGVASVVQDGAASAVAINQLHQIFSGGAVQANEAASVAINQTHLVSIFNGAQANSVSPASAGNIVLGIGHVWRIDTSPFYADTLLIGDPGFGLLGSQIAATGDDGPGYLYNDISLPADADKEISGEIVTWPLHGELFADEDGSFIYTPDVDYIGPDSFEYQLRVEGDPIGSPTLVELIVEGPTQYITPGEALQANSVSSAAIRQATLIGVANVTQGNSVSPASVSQSSTALVTVGNTSQANSASASTVRQTHLVSGANAQQANAASASSIAIDGAHYIAIADALQANAASPAAVKQTHMVTAAPVAVDTVAGASAVVQTHIVLTGSVIQTNSASSVYAGKLKGSTKRVYVTDERNVARTLTQANRTGVIYVSDSQVFASKRKM